MKAIDIAKWFIAWAENMDAEVSNLKIQKLLYYAQGHSLAKFHAPMFEEEIEAWAHGPVVPNVYRAFKDFGKNPIDPDATLANFDWDDFHSVDDQLSEIWNRYGSLAAWALREKTHREAPWVEAFDASTRGSVISKDVIESYFTTLYEP